MRLWFVAASACLSACAGPALRRGDDLAAADRGVAGSAARGAAGAVAGPPARVAVPTWQAIGRSVEEREIRHRVVGSGPRRVILVGGIHGNEREGQVAAREIAYAFVADPGLPERVTLTIVEDLNPDGSAADRRGNARGVDLNRDLPASNRRRGPPAPTQPESRVLHDLIVAVEPDAVIVLHSWGAKPTGPRQFINYDGPGERLARVFATINPDYPVRESSQLAPTPGSLGSWVGRDQQIPIFTIEYARGRDPVRAWRETREGLLVLVRGG